MISGARIGNIKVSICDNSAIVFSSLVGGINGVSSMPRNELSAIELFSLKIK